MANIASMLDHQARRKPGHPAIIEGEVMLTHEALARRVRLWAAHLTTLGMKQGDVIGVALRDSADHIVANLAVARMGGIILPIDHRWTALEKGNVIGGFRAGYVLAEAGDALDGAIALDDAFKAAAEQEDPDGDFPEDEKLPMVLSLSSGTTGTPKGPALNHRQMRSRWVTQFVSLGFTEHDRYLSATPLYFGGGRSFTMSATWAGGTVIMCPPPYGPQELIEAARASRATTTLLVPTILRRLLAEGQGDGLLFPDLRLLLCTGAILHEDERTEVMQRLCPSFINYYGSTEGGGVSILSPQHGGQAAGSVGQAVFNTRVQIVDDAHEPVGAGEIGRIRYRGPGVASGFFNDPEANKETYHEGWFYPGDLGRLDENGYLYLSGRSKEVIIRGGANIYPAEIEEVLLSHPGVNDAAVIGWPSPEMGEEIAAFVTGDGSIDELMAHCREKLASYKCPKQIFPLDSLPKSDLGKVRKLDLKILLPEDF
ncbi:MAG: acyl-CoA synthetase (AMP-forming)/AMP-acid ligase II [Paracoccaceae bacterium]|jgi:acyl-CoA synthetase (AMP-forming)/AMP-acid ligase II